MNKSKFISKITKAKIIINNDSDMGKYVCDHTARINHSFKLSSEFNFINSTGFIHVPEKFTFEKLSELIGIIIKSFNDKHNENNINIMLTGFTKFGNIPDNPTGEFLFGDGISIDKNSFGFFKPKEKAKKNIYQAIDYFFDIEKSSDYKVKETVIGNSFSVKNTKQKINFILLRLPVDSDLKISNNNHYSDTVQELLKRSISFSKPNLIISLGAKKSLPEDSFVIETNMYGLSEKYTNKISPQYISIKSYGKNNDLSDLLTNNEHNKYFEA